MNFLLGGCYAKLGKEDILSQKMGITIYTKLLLIKELE
jgi:hypothetical protein